VKYVEFFVCRSNAPDGYVWDALAAWEQRHIQKVCSLETSVRA